jgi:hypothetical protein
MLKIQQGRRIVNGEAKARETDRFEDGLIGRDCTAVFAVCGQEVLMRTGSGFSGWSLEISRKEGRGD